MSQRSKKCPFCGETGKQSKEHVWPKWLRDSPSIQNLLSEAHGERFPYEYSDLQRMDNRLVEVQRSVNVARWVPQLTTAVCAKCNNGWMSRLETQVKRSIASVVLTGTPTRISGLDVLAVARWAVKTSMAYQLALGMGPQGVFTPQEMKRMARRQEIPSRCRVWIRSVPGPLQFVATQYRGLFLADGNDVDQLSLRDNLALMLIGMPSLVVVVGVAPAPSTSWLIETLVPVEFGTNQAPQIWPEPGQIDLPTSEGEEFDPSTVFDGIEALHEDDLPGLTDLGPEELGALLSVQRTPDQLLQATLDSFMADCRSDHPDPEASVALGPLGGAELDPEQLSQFFEAAIALANRHAEALPLLVCNRLYNIAHLFKNAEAYPACLFLMMMCAGHPDGGYTERADAWEAAGHAAWHIAAFGLAAELYATQLELEPANDLARFNLAESAFRAGDFAESADVLAELADTGRSESLNDSLTCLEITIDLVVTELGIAHLEGFGGPDLESVFQGIMDEEVPSYDAVHLFDQQLLEHLSGLTDVDAGDLATAQAYLRDDVEGWVLAAVGLLDKNPNHPALLSVLRKGNSFGAEFAESLTRELDRLGSARTLPDGRDAVSYATSHAYTKHTRIKRLLDDANQVMQIL